MSAHALIDSLHGLRRRVKAFAVAYGVALVVALGVGILLAILLIDYELSLDPTGRLMLILVGLGSWGYAAWHWVVRPSMAKVTISHIAGSLEHTYPQFDDRLRSTVDFVDHDVPGSATMKDRVVDQATELARGVDLQQVIVGRPVYLSVAGAVASLLLLIVLTAVAGQEGVLGIALNRLALGHDAWPKRVRIELASDLPGRVTAGQHVDVAVRLSKGDRESRKAILEYRYGEGPWQQLVMSRGPEGIYTAALDARLPQDQKSANIDVRITSGDDQLNKPITVVPKLEIAAVQAGITPPAYVQPQRETAVDLGQRPAVAVTGSQVALKFSFNKDLAAGVQVELRPVKDPNAPDSDKAAPLPKIAWDTNAAAGTAVAHFQADGSFRFTVHATDTDKFTNVGSEEYQVIVREDQLPTVQIEEPRHSEEYVANAKFPIHAVADDDYGVKAARLMVTRLGGQQGAAPTGGGAGNNTWTIDLVKDGIAVAPNTEWAPADSTTDRRRYTLGYDWDLAALQNANLKPGDVLEYSLQVKDNFFLNGKEHDWVSSGKLRATIISLEDLKKETQAQLQTLAGVIESTKKDQDRNKVDTQTLQDTIKQRQKFDEADQAQADRLANKQNDLAVQTQQVTDKLSALDKRLQQNQLPQEDPLRQASKSGSDALQNVVNSPMHQAKESLNNAKDTPPTDPKATPQQKAQDASQRSDNLAQSTQQQQQASEELAKAEQKLGDFTDLDDLKKQAEALAAAQADLNNKYKDKLKDAVGQDPSQMTQQQKQDVNELTQKQDDLKKDTQALIQSLKDKGSQENSKSDADSQQAMKSAAEAGEQAGVTGQQGQSSQSMQQNQQSSAQDAQKQAELGLKQIADILKSTDAIKLAKLQDKLAKIQQLLADLEARQAGHNMDNLLLQGGPDRLAKETKEVTDQLFDLSGRKKEDVASLNPQLGPLTNSQEQTERNARSLLKDTDDLKDPTASAKVEAAANQMERAAVELQNNKLTDAYDPPQVQALKDLVDARKNIDDAKKAADKKANDQKKESIRQAYVELLNKQKELDLKTRNIDALPKDDDGSLSRAAIGQTRPLPKAQQDLAEKATKIGDDLKSLGSIVYNWANDDIVNSMGDVKTNLAKPDTGQPTQIQQQQIEDQLAAMIEELKQLPPPHKDFEDKAGGGSGSGSGGKPKPHMPTDAELRLLKDLQLGINKNTMILDKMADKDNQRITALGTREGDIRGLFDKMVQGATKGKLKLNPPPADDLSRDASDDDITDQEVQQDLLGDKSDSDSVAQSILTTGDRMARVNSRLAKQNDPGEVTQNIEKRIVVGLDAMIKLAQQQQQQSGSGSGKPGEEGGPPQPGDANGGQQKVASGSGPHQDSHNPSAEGAQTDSLNPGGAPEQGSHNVQDDAREWGSLTPRQQRERMETSTDKVIGRYKDQVDEYSKTLAQQESKQQTP
jgi:hypothetical protein